MRKFLHYILKEDGRSGAVVNNVVTYTGTKTPLPQSPDSWQDLQIAWERNLKDHGVLRNFSLPFGFVRNGAKIIRDALYNQSIEEKIFLLIQQLTLVFVNNISYNWLYTYLYRGELDLSAAEDTQDMINVPCMEGGLHKLLKANRATKYTFPFDLDAVTVTMDGIALQENAHYIVSGVISNAAFNNTHTIPITFVNKEGQSFGTAFFSQIIEDANPRATYVASSTNYFVVNNSGVSQTYHLKGNIRYMCTQNSAGLSYRWFLTEDDDTSIDLYNSITNPVVGIAVDVPVDVTFTLGNGEKMFLIGRYYGTGGITIAVDFIEGSELNLTFESTYQTTYIKAYKKLTLFRKLVGAMGIDPVLAKSQLCVDWDYIVITSGDAIRGLPNATITTSLNDFSDDMDSTFMAGLSIENGLIEIEGRAKYYDDSNPLDLGIIKDFTITPATEFIYNKFKFGHIKPDIEDINGKYDPNGSAEFTGPITKVVKDYDMVSPYRAGPYEIESLRLNLDGKITTDDNRDNNTYVINCLPSVPIVSTVSFSSDGYFIIGSAQFLAVGQQIQISGSALNDGIYNITAMGSLIIVQLVVVSGTLVNESNVIVTITILRGEVLLLNRPGYTTLSGVPNNTIFNLPKLTPKAMLLAHQKWIRSMNYGLDTELIKFNSGDKNTELLTTLAGITIDENADESIGGFGEKMFLPFYFNFTTEVPVNLVEILEATPNRCFKFTDPDKNIFTGFLISAAIAPNDSKEQEFKLLASKNNNLTLLV
jgi:hypothetical protein